MTEKVISQLLSLHPSFNFRTRRCTFNWELLLPAHRPHHRRLGLAQLWNFAFVVDSEEEEQVSLLVLADL